MNSYVLKCSYNSKESMQIPNRQQWGDSAHVCINRKDNELMHLNAKKTFWTWNEKNTMEKILNKVSHEDQIYNVNTNNKNIHVQTWTKTQVHMKIAVFVLQSPVRLPTVSSSLPPQTIRQQQGHGNLCSRTGWFWWRGVVDIKTAAICWRIRFLHNLWE